MKAPASRSLAPATELKALRTRVAELETRCAQLSRSEQQYRLIVEHFPNGAIHLIDRELNYLVSDGELLDDIGYPRERLSGSNMRAVLPPDILAFVLPHFEIAFGGSPSEYECWWLGRFFHVFLLPIFDKNGSVPMVLAMAQDLTARRQAEDKLARFSEMLSQALSLANMGPWVVDLATGEVDGSPEMLAILGIGPEDDKPPLSYYLDRLHPDDRSRVETALQLALAGQEAYCGEQRFLHPDGSIRHHRTISRFKLDDDGIPRQIVGTTMDVTGQVEAELAKRAAEEELARQRLLQIRADRLRSLGEMSAGIAHELNQPLVGIRGQAEHLQLALQRGWNQDRDTVDRKLQLILAQVDRMGHIVNHVRRFAGQATSPERLPIDIDEVIRSSAELMETHLKSHGVELTLDLAGALPPVLANRYSLEEVFLNLIVNARDAIDEARAAASAAGRLLIRSRLCELGSRPAIGIDIVDDGAGIPPEVLERLFEPFLTTKSPDRGTGLGLAIARAIVREFGGQIDLQPNPGSGATASVVLPVMSTSG